MMRTRSILIALAAALFAAAGVAVADNQSVTDPKKDSKALKSKPELDIVRATAGHAVGGKLKHKITMRGQLDPKSKNTRPFILINTEGGQRSEFEYLVLGRRVFKVKNNGKFVKVGQNKFTARKRTWVYRFKAKSFGNPASYGWAALTAKGKTVDLAPNRRYLQHETSP